MSPRETNATKLERDAQQAFESYLSRIKVSEAQQAGRFGHDNSERREYPDAQTVTDRFLALYPVHRQCLDYLVEIRKGKTITVKHGWKDSQ